MEDIGNGITSLFYKEILKNIFEKRKTTCLSLIKT